MDFYSEENLTSMATWVKGVGGGGGLMNTHHSHYDPRFKKLHSYVLLIV